MGKRRVKQQNVSVTGLFKLAGRRKKMDDVFVNHVCQSTRKKNSAKKKKNIYIYIYIYIYIHPFSKRFSYRDIYR